MFQALYSWWMFVTGCVMIRNKHKIKVWILKVPVCGVQIFHSLFWPLEFTVPGRDNNRCYAKMICNKLDNVTIVSMVTRSVVSDPSSSFTLITTTVFCPSAGSSHRLPLPGSKRRGGDAGLRCRHEMWSHQGAAGRHHRDPPHLCWGNGSTLWTDKDWMCCVCPTDPLTHAALWGASSGSWTSCSLTWKLFTLNLCEIRP